MNQAPVWKRLKMLMKAPLASASSAEPANALLIQCAMNIVRTPRRWNWPRRRSTWAAVQAGLPMDSLHPSGSEDSMPMITASLPCAMTRRACAGSSTMRNQPLPGPPLWRST